MMAQSQEDFSFLYFYSQGVKAVQYNPMYSEVHANRVLYDKKPKAGSKYRQIAVVEKNQFEVRIFEGEVVQTDPKFIAESEIAEITFHPTLKSALQEAEKEFQSSTAAGWIPYSPYNP